MSEQAAERRRLFREAKKRAGSASKLITENNSKQWNILYSDDGTIVAMSKDDTFENKGNVVVLTEDEVRKELQYTSSFDKHEIVIENDKPRIQRKQNVIKWLKRSEQYVIPVEDNSHDPDVQIKITVTEKALKFSLTAKGRKAVEASKSLQEATLRFYVTAYNDPHFLYNKEMISVSELLAQKTVTRKQEIDCTQLSIYTKKVLDKYSIK